MPRRDRTGPDGKGPLTGRGIGDCGEVADYRSNLTGMGRGPRNGEGPGLGKGYGPGRGRGRYSD